MPIPTSVSGFRRLYPDNLQNFSDRQVADAAYRTYFSNWGRDSFDRLFLGSQPPAPPEPEPAPGRGLVGTAIDIGTGFKAGLYGFKAGIQQAMDGFGAYSPEFRDEAQTVLQAGGDLDHWLRTGDFRARGEGGAPLLDTRGVRNNNPGNIRQEGDQYDWQGEVGTDADGFMIFDTPENGIRALNKVLDTYRDRHGLQTVRQIIGRYAPPTENDTDSYVTSVSKSLGIGPDQAIPWDRKPELVNAIVRHENGGDPYGPGNAAHERAALWFTAMDTRRDEKEDAIRAAFEARDALVPDRIREDRWAPSSLAFSVSEAVGRMSPGLVASALSAPPRCP